MRGIILFKGKYGATKQYAEWLGAELKAPVIDADELTVEIVSRYDYLVIGSSVYVGKLQLRDWIKRLEPLLRLKKVFFFIVCATSPDQKEKLNEISQNNIPSSLRDDRHIYFLPGRMIKKKLSVMDRFVLKMGAWLQKDPAARAAMLQDFDQVRSENLGPIIRDVHNSITNNNVRTAGKKSLV